MRSTDDFIASIVPMPSSRFFFSSAVLSDQRMLFVIVAIAAGSEFDVELLLDDFFGRGFHVARVPFARGFGRVAHEELARRHLDRSVFQPQREVSRSRFDRTEADDVL